MNIVQPLQTPTGQQAAAALCCALLRGECVQWPFGDDDATQDRFLDFVTAQGVDALLVERLPQLAACPGRLCDNWRQQVRARAAWELQGRALVSSALAALADGGIDCLVLKGTALAYSCYANPVWRSRGDTDLLVADADRQRAVAVLAAAGFRAGAEDSHLVHYQQDLCAETAAGRHCIDLHWRISNSELLSQCLAWDELAQRAVPLSALAATAKGLGVIDALLLACLHRAVHLDPVHYEERLIWLYDLDRLLRELTAGQWPEFAARAVTKGLASTCREAFEDTVRCFATPLPPDWRDSLTVARQGDPDRYLRAGTFARLWLDFCACRGWQRKLQFCRLHLLPPAAYMRRKYAGTAFNWLPWLYLRRAAGGVLARLMAGGRA